MEEIKIVSNQDQQSVDQVTEDAGDFSSLTSNSQLGREEANLLDSARERLLLSIHGPTENQSFQSVIREAHQQVEDMFKRLPEVLNRPGSENTARGQYDSEPLDTTSDPVRERQLKEFNRECKSISAQFKARFLQVHRIGIDIIKHSKELDPGPETEALSKAFSQLTTDMHNASKVFDQFAILEYYAQDGNLPEEIVSKAFPRGVESILEESPLSAFDTGGTWDPDNLVKMFGCSSEKPDFDRLQAEQMKLVFAEPGLLTSIDTYASRKGVFADVLAKGAFQEALIPEVVLDAVDVAVDNASDELCRDGMKERLLQYGTAGKVSVLGSIAENGDIIISIQDNAFGLDASLIEKWGSGQQITTKLESSDYQRTGSGIGMNQALDIIHALGGTTEIATGPKEADRTILRREADGSFSVSTQAQSRWPVHGTTVTFRLPSSFGTDTDDKASDV